MSDWRNDGACTTSDADLFFHLDPSAAIEVCNGCPVKTECFQWAIDHHPVWGVWGGTNETERQAMRRGQARPPGKRYQQPKPEIQERRQKVALWHSRGQSSAQIAAVLGVSADIVSADLKRMKAAA